MPMLNDDSDVDEFEEMMDWISEGRSLDADAARQLEEHLLESPADIESRIKLIGCYFTKRHRSEAISAARNSHIEWLVDNRPEHLISGSGHANLADDHAAFAKVKAKWIAQVEANPTNTKILSNASSFLSMNTGDPNDEKIAEFYLVECTKLEPTNTSVSSQLSSAYDQNGLIDAKKSFDENQRIVDLLSDPEELFHALRDLPLRAFRACAYKHSLIAAEKLLLLAEEFKDDDCVLYGNAVQSAHTTLGLLALRENDVNKAKYRLAQSAIEEKPIMFELYDPHLELAEKLLDQGERQAVLEYVDHCESILGTNRKEFVAFRKRLS